MIDEDSIAYIRLVNHIKFLMVRLDHKEDVQVSMTDYTKRKVPRKTMLLHVVSLII